MPLCSDVDSHVHKGYVVGKGFIDCTQKPIPAPLQEGSKVVVLCGTRLGSYTCLTAAEATIACLATMSSYRTIVSVSPTKNEAVLLRHLAPMLQVFMNFCEGGRGLGDDRGYA